MAFENIIPQSKSPIDAFSEGIASSQNMINALTENKLKAAQTAREQKMADLPFGGATVPGPAGQVMGLEMIRKLYGENSPQYQQASSAFQTARDSDLARINYQRVLTSTLPVRSLTPGGKQTIETSYENQGDSPTGTPSGEPVAAGLTTPYVPPSKQTTTTQEGRDTGLTKLNAMLPASVKDKLQYATNIDKTLDSINPDDLFAYSGVNNAFDLAKEKVLDAQNQSSDKYKKYKQQKDLIDFLSSQANKFYAESIQPEELKRKMERFDSSGLFTGSDTAKGIFNKSKELLKKELQTYRQAALDPSAYARPQTNDEQTGKPVETKVDASNLSRKDVIAIANADQKKYDDSHSSKKPRVRTYNLKTGRFEG